MITRLFPSPLPLVTALDGHPSALAFLGAAAGAPIATLGVTEFGESGSLDSLYQQHRIDAETIVGASLDLLSG